jgi:hypothetical protein
MIGTYKGYLLCHDIRTNLTMKTSRLIFDKKMVPIVSCTEFVPNTKYNHISEDSELVALTYPSKCNQFSIFDINYIQTQENPRIHFECKTESKTTKPIEYPTLEDVSQVETILDYDAICNEHFEYLNQIYLKENNTFGLGELFNFRSVDSIVSLYTDKFDATKFKIKEECMKNFQDVMQALSSMGENNQTLNKFISLPSERVSSSENLIDNIILTGGTDRNIRFMSLGNDFDKVDQDCNEFSTMNSYHVSNMDNQPRSFRYVYSKDMLILKEVSGVTGQSGFTFNDFVGEGQHSIKNPKNGLSYYHNCFLSQRKTADTLPGHSAAINDMIVMDTKDVRDQRENRDALLLLSCGDDGSIKVWA